MMSLDRILPSACVIAGADLDLALQSNRRDQWLIVSNATLLVIVAALALTAWAITIHTFTQSLLATLCGATLIASIVFMLDRAMASSDWHLSGLLASMNNLGPAQRREVWIRITARVIVAFVLSLGTSVGLMMAAFSGRIDEQLRTQRNASNAPLTELLSQRSAEAERRLLGNVDADIATLRSELASSANRQKHAEAMQAATRQDATNARLNADRELLGDIPGSPRGNGPRFREWQRRQQTAQELAPELQQTIAAAVVQQQTLKAQIDAKQQALAVARRQLDLEIASLRHDIQTDPRWVPERTDVLSRYTALQRLKQHPEDGAAASVISLGFNLLLITLEMAFLLVKTVFAPTSVYAVRLITSTRMEVEQLMHDYNERLTALRSTASQRAVLRLVPREEGTG